MIDQRAWQNGILRAVSVEDNERIQPELDFVTLERGALLADTGGRLGRVYFPLSAEISFICPMSNGAVVEMATVGREGMVQVSAIFGSDVALAPIVVQVPGAALTIRTEVFQQHADQSPAFRQVLIRYGEAFLFHTLQSVACNAVHSARARVARWLLTCCDRGDTLTCPLTQESLAGLLGVSRPTVSTITGALQREGLIRYHRGIITITNPAELRAASCECYRLIRRAYEDRLLGWGAR